jgi:hypothetical protein
MINFYEQVREGSDGIFHHLGEMDDQIEEEVRQMMTILWNMCAIL